MVVTGGARGGGRERERENEWINEKKREEERLETRKWGQGVPLISQEGRKEPKNQEFRGLKALSIFYFLSFSAYHNYLGSS